jgi:hypothetical protein
MKKRSEDMELSYYHGTLLESAEEIAEQGFKVWFWDVPTEDAEGCYAASTGVLGNGIYISRSWESCLLYGKTLLRVSLKAGTRVLDLWPEPDQRVVNYLRREFGSEILRQAPWKVLPKNKKLTQSEIINLIRYHFHESIDFNRPPEVMTDKKMQKQCLHSSLMMNFRSMLLRCNFHGYGENGDEIGVVIFSPERLILRELLADLSGEDCNEIYQAPEVLRPNVTLDTLRRLFERRGSDRAKKLAKLIAERRP